MTSSAGFITLRGALNSAGYNGLNMWGSSRQLSANGLYKSGEVGIVYGVFANSNNTSEIYIQYVVATSGTTKYVTVGYANDLVKDTVMAL